MASAQILRSIEYLYHVIKAQLMQRTERKMKVKSRDELH